MREFHSPKAHFLSRIGRAKRIGFGRQIRDIGIARRVLRHIDRGPFFFRKLGQRLPGFLRSSVPVVRSPEGLHEKNKADTNQANKSEAQVEQVSNRFKSSGLAPHPVSPFTSPLPL